MRVGLALTVLVAGVLAALLVGTRWREGLLGWLAAGREPSPEASRAAGRADSEDALLEPPGQLRITLADRLPARLPAEGVPEGWALWTFAGAPSMELLRDGGRVALRLRSDRASFALYRDVVVDLDERPVLSWSWKVVQLPRDADVRDPASDDQAAQLYVIFPRWPSPRTSSDVIGYVWDSRAPVGTMLPHPRAPNVRIVVVDSGTAQLDRWVQHERNVAEDFRVLFGRRPPRVGQVALMIDSNDTQAAAEAFFGPLTFGGAGSARLESSENSIAVLR